MSENLQVAGFGIVCLGALLADATIAGSLVTVLVGAGLIEAGRRCE